METRVKDKTGVKAALKPFLSKGDIKEIAEKHKCTVYNVNKVLNEDVNNPYILESLIEKAEYSKSIKKRLEDFKSVA
jgi:hypothetical protein